MYKEAKQYNLTHEGDEANIDTMFVSGHLYLTHEKAVEQSKVYPLKNFLFFRFLHYFKRYKSLRQSNRQFL